MISWPTMTYIWIVLLIAVNVLVTTWVLIGGWFDLLFFLRELAKERIDVADDGRVTKNGPRDVVQKLKESS